SVGYGRPFVSPPPEGTPWRLGPTRGGSSFGTSPERGGHRRFLARSLHAPPRAGTTVWEHVDPAGLRIAGVLLFACMTRAGSGGLRLGTAKSPTLCSVPLFRVTFIRNVKGLVSRRPSRSRRAAPRCS